MANVTIITSKNCYDCSIIKDSLNELVNENPSLTMEEVGIESQKGKKLIDDLGIMALPALIVNGQLFSTGFINKQDLQDYLFGKAK